MMNSERKSQREVLLKKLRPLDLILSLYEKSGSTVSILVGGSMMISGTTGGMITNSMRKFFGKEIRVTSSSTTYYEYCGVDNAYLWRETWFENDYVDKELFEI